MKKALGLVGLLALSSGVKAQDTDYMNLSESEVQSEILRRAQRFRYEDNFYDIENKKPVYWHPLNLPHDISDTWPHFSYIQPHD